MEETKKETETPQTPTEPTVPSNPVPAKTEAEKELEALKQQNVELQAQKEHWRGKYERDITSVIQTPVPTEEPDDVYSDEGKALKAEIDAVREKLRETERREARREAEVEFPFLKDKKEEFDAFLEDEENKRISVRKAAKLFAAENGLLETQPERKGLEEPTGGGQVVPEPSYSAEEIRDMMKNDWKKYEKLLKEGKI